MALDNHSNLTTAIITWSHRKDVDALINDFIALTEAEMYAMTGRLQDGTRIDPIRLRSMEVRATADTVTDSRFIALPDRFLEMRRLSIIEAGGGTTDIVYQSPEQMSVIGATGKPAFFTTTTQLEFNRIPDVVYSLEMAYMAKFLSLDATNNTNPILTEFPNIYLFGGLWALFQYASDEQKSEFYYKKFVQAVQGANKQDKRGRYGPAPTMRVEGRTP